MACAALPLLAPQIPSLCLRAVTARPNSGKASWTSVSIYVCRSVLKLGHFLFRPLSSIDLRYRATRERQADTYILDVRNEYCGIVRQRRLQTLDYNRQFYFASFLRRARVGLTMAQSVCKFASSAALPHAARQLSTSGSNSRLLAHAAVQTRQPSPSSSPAESPSDSRQPTDLSGISPSPWDDHLDLQEIYGKVRLQKTPLHSTLTTGYYPLL